MNSKQSELYDPVSLAETEKQNWTDCEVFELIAQQLEKPKEGKMCYACFITTIPIKHNFS